MRFLTICDIAVRYAFYTVSIHFRDQERQFGNDNKINTHIIHTNTAYGGANRRLAGANPRYQVRGRLLVFYWLGKVGGTLKVLRPAHTEQNPVAQAGRKH